MTNLNWGEITALFGGAFDPPHLGHREVASGLFKNPGVREVRIIPTGNPALKSAQTAALHRLEMARLNFAGLVNPSGRPVSVDDREIRKSERSFTFDTLREIRAEFGVSAGSVAPLAFVIGVDQLENFEKWNHFPALLGLCHWIVLERAPGGAEKTKKALQKLETLGVLIGAGSNSLYSTKPGQGPSTTLLCVSTPAREVSSTGIRREFALAKPSSGKKDPEKRSNLAADVESYLKAHRLYGT